MFERLSVEFRQIEGMRGKDFPSVDLVDEDLCKWKVTMKFHEGSVLQRELNHYGDKMVADKTKKVLDVRLYFPHDYPQCPPEVRVHEPRVNSSCELITFGGIFKTVLLGHDWTETLTAKDIITDIHLRLSMCEVSLAPPSRLLRPYHDKPKSQDPVSLRSSAFPTVNNFDMEFKVIPAREAGATFGISDLDESDRICLPASLMSKLYTEHTKLPIIFEIKTQEGRVRHMGISDKHSFVEHLPSDTVIVPDWINSELRIPHRSMLVNIRCVQLKPVEQLLLQPHNASFYKDVEACSHLGSNQAILNQAMKDSKLTALTVNTAVKIEVPKPGGSVSHLLEILNVHPPGAARVIAGGEDEWDISFKVDFAPAPDFEDEEDYKKRMSEIEGRMLTKEKAKERRMTEEMKARREELSNLVMMQRCALEDEMPNVGKKGEVEVKLAFPDGTQLDGKFKDGTSVSNITAFIMINSDWVINECVERSSLTLSSAYPKKTFTEADTITAKDLHRNRLMVNSTGSSSPLPAADDDHDTPMPSSPTDTGIERSNTDRLEAAWENATQMQKVRRTMRSEEAMEAARITEMVTKQADMDAAPQAAASGDAAATGPSPEEMAVRIQMVSEISGNPDPTMVESILQACDWDVERAVSLLFEH
eukprot:TRINITY_DN15469_c0_g2_i1.p1 TRINITY_DN15469_c0_g2~~TRINITY_DN15469_c0_g2_i1.p1  ORF type:complete len:647 (+),score=112.91 TRINITY_DN15469_c0_g2_i1:68-2008(+)